MHFTKLRLELRLRSLVCDMHHCTCVHASQLCSSSLGTAALHFSVALHFTELHRLALHTRDSMHASLLFTARNSSSLKQQLR
jgi:hypothetical protein